MTVLISLIKQVIGKYCSWRTEEEAPSGSAERRVESLRQTS
jgi:hypothetical protein